MDDFTEDVDVHAVSMSSDLVSKKMFARLAEATAADPDLRTVLRCLRNGEELQGCLKPFSSELTEVQGIVLKGTKVIIPKAMRAKILGRIHEGHLGINKCKARARRLVFWPGLNGGIENLVKNCAVCQKYAYRQQSEPVVLRPTPEHAWYRIGVDIFMYAGSSYLWVFDAFSNFPEVEKLPDTTTGTVINKLSSIFSRYGIPLEVCTDNGPQFASHEFSLFASRYDFTHVTSSPRFRRSNGLTEKGVQIVKRIMKTGERKEDFWLGLLSYRSTPLDEGRSPEELLQGRKLRNRLPEIRPCSGRQDFRRQSRQPKSSKGKTLPELNKDAVVRVRGDTWDRKARVLDKVVPRSYRVFTEDSRVLRRNRQHLLATRESFQRDEAEDSSTDEAMFQENSWLPSVVQPASTGSSPVSTTSTPTLEHQPRKSTRQRRKPSRLGYDENFNQVTCILMSKL
nr:uncharacterized protein K02A2.6-like [Rhipicephalus microplus]